MQRFLGLVQYLAHFMPDVSAYTGPLAAIQKNTHLFLWKPMHQVQEAESELISGFVCMDNIKVLACKVPILRPIDPSRDEPIWLICDASASGIGAVYGQGPDWHSCRPTGFMSKKFKAVQHNYRVFEMETIAVLKALLKWEDNLLSNCINVVPNHRALEFFKTQRRVSSCQMQWMEYLSRFDFDIQYVKGSSNKVADSPSQYYQSDTEDDTHPTYNFVNADSQLDPEGEDLPWNCVVEICAMTPHSCGLCEATSERYALANKLAVHIPPPEPLESDLSNGKDPTIFEALTAGPKLRKHVEEATDFLK